MDREDLVYDWPEKENRPCEGVIQTRPEQFDVFWSAWSVITVNLLHGQGKENYKWPLNRGTSLNRGKDLGITFLFHGCSLIETWTTAASLSWARSYGSRIASKGELSFS